MCNVRGLNNLVKQDDVICWHKDINNLVSIFTESKLKEKVRPWLADKFDGVRVFTFGLDSGFLGARVLIVVNSSLVKHIYKVSEVSGQLLSIKLLFKNKLSVSILGLYAGASSVVWFFQAGEINSLIAKAVNKSSFVVLGGNFNENGSHKCASFKKCFDLGLINSLEGSSFVKLPTWCNSYGITKTLDYVFVSFNLVGMVVDHGVDGVEDYFDIDHKAVYVSSEFRNAMAANVVMFSDEFNIVYKVMVLLAGGMFKKKWFKGFDCVFNKTSRLVSGGDFALLLNTWNRLDSVSTSLVKSMFLSGAGFDAIRSGLAKVRKSYHSFKLLESKRAEEFHIRQAIERRIKSFEVDKGHTIRSVLEHLFHKVVLDHLVDGGELVLEPELVKSKVDGIMEGWTRKRVVASNISGNWARQFRPLDHVFDGAFSDVMHSISFDEMFGVISNLPDEKATAHKVLSKILSDQISLACSTFDVLHGDNFSVLKGMSTHSPIFAISLVIKDALEKNQELWVILQNMCKAYDSVGWEHLKKSLIGWVEFQAELTSFLATGAFVDDTIWVGSSQTATQHILNVASDFFCLNNILINNNKTVVISINCRIAASYLTISGLSKPSLVKAHLDVQFFVNLILRKVISDKQFAYLVSLVFFSIVSYRTQFSFIPLNVCNKWDALICKGLKSKSRLSLDFPNDAFYHPSLYNLKTFEQIQTESKLASVIAFANSVGVLGCLFSHRSHNLQVLSWHPRHPLLVPVCVRVSLSNNFLAGVVCIFSGCDLSLGGSLVSAFHLQSVSLSSRSPHEGVCGFFDIHQSSDFGVICNDLLDVGATRLSVYTDGSLSNLGTMDMLAGAVVFFENINLGLGVGVSVKSHLGVSNNEHADALVKDAALSAWQLLHLVSKRFLKADVDTFSGNSRHFVHDIFRLIYCAHWKIGSGFQAVPGCLCADINWLRSSLVWHPDFHLIEVSDHGFSCSSDTDSYAGLLNTYTAAWKLHSGLSHFFLCVSQLLLTCISDMTVSMALCKGFVFGDWYHKSVSVYKNPKVAVVNIVNFVCKFCLAFRDNIWLVHVKHWAIMEKNKLIPHDGSIPVTVSGFSMWLLAEVIRLLGVANALGISFGYHKYCLFYADVGNMASVHISA
ncbi:hypothetical protein G9A89_003465 [Geosiphon pyriformis]|nr:hypothetical protein G9A89_003465 [Geosiphon pyriformis]